MGKRSYPETVIEAKRLLAEFTLPEQPSRKPATVVDGGPRLVFAETNSKKEYLKNSTCYACGKKGHLVYGCTSTSDAKKKEILALMKSGKFKAPKSGVVNTNAQEEGGGDNDPPENVNDCKKFMDFIGVEEFNVGVFDDEPAEDAPFGFSL